MLECVAISSSRWSSWPRDWTQVSCIAGGFYTVEPLGKLIYIMVTYKMYFQLTAKKSNLDKLIRPNACMLNRFSRVQLWDPMAVTCRPGCLSTEFSKQEYWSWLPRPPSGSLPHPRTEHTAPADSVLLSTRGAMSKWCFPN